MTRRLLWLLALTLTPGHAFADDVAACTTLITSPAHGATAVPLDVVVTGSSNCPTQMPSFIDDKGAIVPARLEETGDGFRLQPLAPLAPNRRYTVTFANMTSCGLLQGKASFTTALEPGLRHLEFVLFGGQLHGVNVDLSEPVLQAADLADGSTLVSTSIDGFAATPTLASGKDSASFHLGYKHLTSRPNSTQAIHVRLRKGLRFASGAVLAQDIEVTAVPADLVFGWSAIGEPQSCPSDPFGCQVAPRAGGGWAGAMLGGLTLLVLVGRRRWSSQQVHDEVA